ncbi:MAG: PqqD family protein [Clostridia bacterium]|nr:PqqD family protein [Clostridia bacterium]
MIRNNQFIKRKIGAQYVIVALGEATRRFTGMITVNETGSFIWDLLEHSCTIEELVRALTDRYEIDADTAMRDVISFLEQLKSVGAVN